MLIRKTHLLLRSRPSLAESAIVIKGSYMASNIGRKRDDFSSTATLIINLQQVREEAVRKQGGVYIHQIDAHHTSGYSGVSSIYRQIDMEQISYHRVVVAH